MRMTHRSTSASTAEVAEPVAARAQRCSCSSPTGVQSRRTRRGHVGISYGRSTVSRPQHQRSGGLY